MMKNEKMTEEKLPPVKVLRRPKTVHAYERVTDVLDMLRVLEKHGDRVVFTYFVGGKNTEDMTYGQLLVKIKEIAAGLTKSSLAGKKVAIIGETSPEWVATYLAVLASGGIAIPMDKELALPEVEGLLASVNADAICYSARFNGALAEARGNHPSLKTYIPFAPTDEELALDKTVSLSKLCEKGRAAVEKGYTYPPVKNIDGLAQLLFTSGTTGTSKSVMLSQRNIFSCVTSAVSTVDFSPDDVIVSVLPIHHTYELACMMGAMNYGMHVCINDTIPHVLRNFQLFKPTALVLVPLFVYTIYKKIWAEAKKTGQDKKLRLGLAASHTLMRLGVDKRRDLFATVLNSFGGRLEKIVCGGAALNPKMVEFFDSIGIAIYEGYGITECSPLVAVSPYFARKYGSVGPAVPSCQVRIDEQMKNARGLGEGEIQVKGDNVMLGYMNNDAANVESFTEDGWFRTGDMGYMDEEGYIYITGRLKSVIVLENGKNVFPEEIEEYLGDIELIAESVVVGRTEEGDDKVLLWAIVYPDDTKFPEGTDNEAKLSAIEKEIDAMNKKLPTYKHIQKVELREVEFEKTTSRKIKRHLVK